jgi:predicted ester cyclase
MAPDDLPAIIQRAIDEIWSRGDLDVADRLFTPDYVNHGGLIPDLVHGPEAIKFSVTMYRLAFPGLRIAVENLVVDGETATFRWAAHTAVAGGEAVSPAAASAVSMAGAMVVRVVGGRIAESWTSWDAEDALRRLGRDLTRRTSAKAYAA